MAKLSLHIGMDKTGTTTLQHMFAGQHGLNASVLGPISEPERINDVFFEMAQHSDAASGIAPATPLDVLAHRVVTEHRQHAVRSRQNHQLDATRRLRTLLSVAPDHLLISSEDLSSLGHVRTILDTLSATGRTVRALSYARGLASATVATFQEILHSAPQPLAGLIAHCPERDLLSMFAPRYNQRLSPWLDHLGPEQFEIHAYDQLRRKGVQALVDDFSNWSGLQPLRSCPQLNTQDSAEVIAITYALLAEMPAARFDPVLFQFARATCAKFGHRKLILGPEAVSELVRLQEGDVDWIEAQTGQSFRDPDDQQGIAICSASDLHGVAHDLCSELCAHIDQRWGISFRPDTGWHGFFDSFRRAAQDRNGRLQGLPRDFDSAAYLATNPDVALADCDPIEHYLSHGFFEGRFW